MNYVCLTLGFVALLATLSSCGSDPESAAPGAQQATSGAGAPAAGMPEAGGGRAASARGGAGADGGGAAGVAGVGLAARGGAGASGASGIAGARSDEDVDAGSARDDGGTDTAGMGGMMAGMGGMGGAAGASSAPVCAGKPGAKRGKLKQTIMLGGLERWFNYYAPASLDPNVPVPLVIVPHGFAMDADIMYEVTKYSELADSEKFVVAFPSGAGPTTLDPPWNIGSMPAPQCLATVGYLPVTENDDQAFLDAIIKFAQDDQCIDRNHIFMTGFSMGAYFTNTTGCQREDIKAIAPHSGGSHDFANCKVKNKPVLLMHFETDALIPYQCGTETRDRWLKLNGCQTAAPEVKMVKGGRCEYYKGCVERGQVAMCTFQYQMPDDELFDAHGWSGGYEPQPVGLSGYAIPETESATRLSWEFFKTYAW